MHPKLGVQVGFQSEGLNEVHCFGSATEDSIFDIASVSKAFMTSYLCMIGVEKKLLSLDSKVSDFFECSEDLSEISIKEMLSHTSGLAAWLPMYGLVSSRKEAKSYLLNLKIDKKTKGERLYSDLGFMIIGFILEEVFKNNLDKIFLDHVLSPLGLKKTFFQNTLNAESMPTSNGNPFEKTLIQDRKIEVTKSIKWRDKVIQNEVNDFNCSYIFEGVSGHCGIFSNSFDLLEITKSLLENAIVSGAIRNSFMNDLIQGNALGFLADSKLMKFKLDKNWRGHHGFTGCSVFLNTESNEAFTFLSNRQVAGLRNNKYPDWKLN